MRGRSPRARRKTGRKRDDLVSFAPTGDVVFGLTGNTLHATGGTPAAGTLGPAKIGELVVEGVEGGVLALIPSDSVSASQTLETIPADTVVFVPEPGAFAMLASGAIPLGWLDRRNQTRERNRWADTERRDEAGIRILSRDESLDRVRCPRAPSRTRCSDRGDPATRATRQGREAPHPGCGSIDRP